MKADYAMQTSITLDHLIKRGAINADQHKGLGNTLGQAGAVMGKFQAGVASILASGKYTEVGATAEKAALAEKTKDALAAAVNGPLKAIEDQIGQARSSLQRAPSTSGDAVLSYLREREIRDRLMTMNPDQVEAAYLQAATEGNDLLCAAVEAAPHVGRPMITMTALQAGLQVRLERQNPEASRLIGQLTQMKTAIEVIHKTALRELEAEAGHLGPDVIAQAAAGNAVLNTV